MKKRKKRSGIVAICGRPNSGKSTLLNQILGTELSIATVKAQTTRERIHGIYTQDQGQIVFVDTPGMHRARKGGLNEQMVKEVERALDEPDVIWYLVDPSSKFEHEKIIVDLLKKVERPLVLVMNKADQMSNLRLRTELEKELRISLIGSHSISALKNTNIDILLQSTWEKIPYGEFLFDDEESLSDRPVRYFLGEKIRKQLYRCLGDELPYSCAVRVDSVQEETDPVRVEASILVERPSQKGMVIGARGKKIKEIGEKSRKEFESFLQKKVFLGLNVEVLKNWTREKKHLKSLGYDLS